MKKKITILVILLIILVLILNCFSKTKKINFEDIIIFGLWQDIGKDNEFVLDTKSNKSVLVNIYKTIKGGRKLYQKIAPGTKGEFIIRLKRDEGLKCKIIINNVTQKPQNLEFSLNNITYYSLEEMQKEINNILSEKDEVTINWEWKYDIDEQNDIEDTKDGEIAKEYVFRMDTIVED